MASRNTEPEEQWLDVWRHISDAVEDGLTEDDITFALTSAVRDLYLLLEPPSVREARRKTNDVG